MTSLRRSSASTANLSPPTCGCACCPSASTTPATVVLLTRVAAQVGWLAGWLLLAARAFCRVWFMSVCCPQSFVWCVFSAVCFVCVCALARSVGLCVGPNYPSRAWINGEYIPWDEDASTMRGHNFLVINQITGVRCCVRALVCACVCAYLHG